MPTDIKDAKIHCNNHSRQLLTCNIQSFNKNHESIKQLTQSLCNPTFISLVEVWHPKLSMHIPNYHLPINQLRSNKKGGGISVYVRDHLEFEKYDIINKINCNHIEKLALKIIDKNCKTFLLITIYRPPGPHFKRSLDELKAILESANLSGLPVILSGDLNIDTLSKDSFSKDYFEILQTFQLIQHIREPTRISSHKKSLIDHIVSNSQIEPLKTLVLCFTVADHLPTLALWHRKKEKTREICTESISRVDYKKLKTLLSNKKNESDPIENLNCNEAFDNLHERVRSCLAKATYVVAKRDRPKNPWISKDTIELGKTVQRLRKKFIKFNTVYNEFQYKNSKREHQKSIRENKNRYYKTKLENCKGDSKKTWRIINECLNRPDKKGNKSSRKEHLIIDGKLIESNEDMATEFNKFYKNIAFDIAKKIEPSIKPQDYYLQQSKEPIEPFDLIEVTEDEVHKTVMSLTSKSSLGPDGVSNKILKNIIPVIIKELTICINKSFLEASFPQSLKVSKITPIFKSGDRSDPNNWRPINNLSPFSKTYEQVFMTQVTEQLTRNEIIDPRQFGFRSFHSTIHPLLITKNYIETELRNKKYVCLIALDLMKAFECVKTEGSLQNKITYYSKNIKITNWVDSYYTDRVQFTNWEKCNSGKVKNHQISIVQGSSLGPKIFNLYINDLPKISNLQTILFADDSNFLLSNKNPEELNQQVNEELKKIKDYFNCNGLSVSIKKTSFMTFTPKNKEKIKLDIKIGIDSIQENKEIKFLGVIIDNKLNFSPHFNKVYDKVKKGLNGLIMVKNQLSQPAKLNVYHSLIHSHLDYCAMIWISNISKKQLKMLKVIQKKALRIVFGTKYNAHTGGLFQSSRITKVENIFERDSLLMTFKYQNRSLPKAIIELYDNSLYANNILTRHQTSCILRPKKELRNRDLMYDIINNWNRIGRNLREEKYYKEFKITLKSLLNKYLKCDKINCYSCLQK